MPHLSVHVLSRLIRGTIALAFNDWLCVYQAAPDNAEGVIVQMCVQIVTDLCNAYPEEKEDMLREEECSKACDFIETTWAGYSYDVKGTTYKITMSRKIRRFLQKIIQTTCLGYDKHTIGSCKRMMDACSLSTCDHDCVFYSGLSQERREENMQAFIAYYQDDTFFFQEDGLPDARGESFLDWIKRETDDNEGFGFNNVVHEGICCRMSVTVPAICPAPSRSRVPPSAPPVQPPSAPPVQLPIGVAASAANQPMNVSVLVRPPSVPKTGGRPPTPNQSVPKHHGGQRGNHAEQGSNRRRPKGPKNDQPSSSSNAKGPGAHGRMKPSIGARRNTPSAYVAPPAPAPTGSTAFNAADFAVL